jgi:hypothetical protein
MLLVLTFFALAALQVYTGTMRVFMPAPRIDVGVDAWFGFFNETLARARSLRREFDDRDGIMFHAFWVGRVNENIALSVQSLFLHSVVHRRRRRIIVWTLDPSTILNDNSSAYESVRQLIEVRRFDCDEQTAVLQSGVAAGHGLGAVLFGKAVATCARLPRGRMGLSFFSDHVRYMLLYNYGGVWFDLDVLFLRSLDPLFAEVCTPADFPCVYAWERQQYPNGAVYVALQPRSPMLLRTYSFLLSRGSASFTGGHISYASHVELTVLPCSWFDASWVPNPLASDGDGQWDWFFDRPAAEYDMRAFDGAFAFHFHNRWAKTAHQDSNFAMWRRKLQTAISLFCAPYINDTCAE